MRDLAGELDRLAAGFPAGSPTHELINAAARELERLDSELEAIAQGGPEDALKRARKALQNRP